jgi:hypothetical protein
MMGRSGIATQAELLAPEPTTSLVIQLADYFFDSLINITTSTDPVQYLLPYLPPPFFLPIEPTRISSHPSRGVPPNQFQDEQVEQRNKGTRRA